MLRRFQSGFRKTGFALQTVCQDYTEKLIVFFAPPDIQDMSAGRFVVSLHGFCQEPNASLAFVVPGRAGSTPPLCVLTPRDFGIIPLRCRRPGALMPPAPARVPAARGLVIRMVNAPPPPWKRLERHTTLLFILFFTHGTAAQLCLRRRCRPPRWQSCTLAEGFLPKLEAQAMRVMTSHPEYNFEREVAMAMMLALVQPRSAGPRCTVNENRATGQPV